MHIPSQPKRTNGKIAKSRQNNPKIKPNLSPKPCSGSCLRTDLPQQLGSRYLQRLTRRHKEYRNLQPTLLLRHRHIIFARICLPAVRVLLILSGSLRWSINLATGVPILMQCTAPHPVKCVCYFPATKEQLVPKTPRYLFRYTRSADNNRKDKPNGSEENRAPEDPQKHLLNTRISPSGLGVAPDWLFLRNHFQYITSSHYSKSQPLIPSSRAYKPCVSSHTDRVLRPFRPVTERTFSSAAKRDGKPRGQV